ncbi:MAG: T9SS type A sorting domain-containing protein [Flavobacteriales bacterium]|nr:T9SS type A sorting domain-containing protein [Flavobacteriales bacterium]
MGQLPKAISFVVVGLLAVHAIAQDHCKVRYSYNAAGDRIKRDWYCWTPGEEEPPLVTKSATIAEVELGVMPNPASEELFVTVPEEYAAGSLDLVSSTGSVVATMRVQGVRNVFDVRALRAGTYFLRFQHGNEWIITPCVIE